MEDSTDRFDEPAHRAQPEQARTGRGSDAARARYDTFFGEATVSTFTDPDYIWHDMAGAPEEYL